ncbi:hypothetical protein [Komagataeibacter xylinus]|uniref:hypothetical protein n=1 Tax=Komagataeibacter xylinus TaxID=28448 RepID=UPI000FDFA033|nr:hypothetical protein [Komagataeibacter xylinus]AZV39941.1 hypothetical protein CXP35_15375 [Komagataeibacter xylinus]
MKKSPLLAQALRTDAFVKRLLARAYALRDSMRACRAGHSTPAGCPTSVAPDWLERGLGQPEAQPDQSSVAAYDFCHNASQDDIQAFRALPQDMMLRELNTLLRRYDVLLSCAEDYGINEVTLRGNARAVILAQDVPRSFYRGYFGQPTSATGETR